MIFPAKPQYFSSIPTMHSPYYYYYFYYCYC